VPFTRQVWEKIALVLKLQSIWDGNSSWTVLTLGPKGNTISCIFHPLFAGLFGWKGIKLFLKMGPLPQVLQAYKALGIFNSWNDSHSSKPRLQHTKKGPDLDDTPTGWFDGATLSNGSQSGAGGLIKISQNTFYKWTFNCGPGTNTRAELLGAWATLYLASRLHIEVLQVLGDSRIVIEWLSNKGDLQAISLLAWKDRIRLLQPTFKKLSLQPHIS
jgi:hypothetical protein